MVHVAVVTHRPGGGYQAGEYQAVEGYRSVCEYLTGIGGLRQDTEADGLTHNQIGPVYAWSESGCLQRFCAYAD